MSWMLRYTNWPQFVSCWWTIPLAVCGRVGVHQCLWQPQMIPKSVSQNEQWQLSWMDGSFPGPFLSWVNESFVYIHPRGRKSSGNWTKTSHETTKLLFITHNISNHQFLKTLDFTAFCNFHTGRKKNNKHRIARCFTWFLMSLQQKRVWEIGHICCKSHCIWCSCFTSHAEILVFKVFYKPGVQRRFAHI